MKHLDEATIQAFLDGETPDALTAQITQHLSLCDKCTNALMAVEAELADLNLAFAAEASAPIPTQRIWARIENEIDYLEAKTGAAKAGRKSFWEQVAAFLSPSQVAFAGGLAAVVLVSLFGLSVVQQKYETPDTAVAVNNSNPIVSTNSTPVSTSTPVETVLPTVDKKEETTQPRVIKASYTPKRVQPKAAPKSPAKYIDVPLTGEKDYLDSIAQLSKAADTNGDFALSASFRVEYERNMAMMNESIKQMQRQARRNPNDENAKRILFASYQNKIDLLNTVSEKSQLMVALK